MSVPPETMVPESTLETSAASLGAVPLDISPSELDLQPAPGLRKVADHEDLDEMILRASQGVRQPDRYRRQPGTPNRYRRSSRIILGRFPTGEEVKKLLEDRDEVRR